MGRLVEDPVTTTATGGNGRADAEPAPRWADRWRVRALVRTPQGDQYAFEVTFVRSGEPQVPGPARTTLSCGTTDITGRAFARSSWLDGPALRACRTALAHDTSVDWRVRAAFDDALATGVPTLPDRLFSHPVTTAPDGKLDFGPVGAFESPAEGSWRLRLADEAQGLDVLLEFLPCFDGQRWRGSGVVATFTGRDGSPTTATGTAWYEEPSDESLGPGAAADTAGNELSLYLDNGWHLDLDSCSVADGPGPHQRFLRATAPDGRLGVHTCTVSTEETWTSLATLNVYPVRWRLRVPDLALDLTVQARVPEQESRSLLTGVGWRGHATVHGSLGHRPVGGDAFAVTEPDGGLVNLERHMSSIGRVVREEIRALYPDACDRASVHSMAGLRGGESLDDSCRRDLAAALSAPVRHLSDVGGKTWRPYSAAAVLEMFGTGADRYRPLLAAIELLHIGSLIIDDVQDSSPLRRGRPAAHTVYGQALAINAGTAAYFAFDRVLRDTVADDPELRLRIYEVYLLGLRAGHAGQALDIAGHTAAMDHAVDSGDPTLLLERLRTTHRLKSGIPARGTCEIAALLAGADRDQIRATGDYFEAMGLAYQISDDVADLYGVTTAADRAHGRAAKRACDDLHQGKVTMPLAHAVGLMPPSALRALWAGVRGGATDSRSIEAASRALRDCGAVAACENEAEQLVELAWNANARHWPHTQHKVMLRAVGWYAARREPDRAVPFQGRVI